MIKMIKVYLLAGLFLTVITSSSFAQGPGTTAANFLKIGPGAKAIALGEAFTAIADDSSCLYWNPAGLVKMDKPQLSVTYNSWLVDSSQGYVGFAYPLSQKECVGLAINYADAGKITRTGPEGDELGEFSAQDTHISFGYGRYLTPGISFGLTAGYITDKIDGSEASCFTGSLGLLYEETRNLIFGDKFSFGLALLHIGGTLQGDYLPRTIKLGVATQVKSLTFSLDAGFPCDNTSYIGMGVDWQISKGISLRVGYRGNNDVGEGLTAGVGLSFRNVSLDYAFVPYENLGESHRFSLGLNW